MSKSLLIRRYRLKPKRQRPTGIPTDVAFHAPFGSDYADHSGDARTMTLVGNAPTFGTVLGVPCATFEAQAGLWTTIGSMASGDNSFTMSMWLRMTKPSFTASGKYPCLAFVGKAMTRGAGLVVYSVNNGMVMSGIEKLADIKPAYQCDMEWHHYCLCYNTNTAVCSLFIDGNKQGGMVSNRLSIPSDSTIAIGCKDSSHVDSEAFQLPYNVAQFRIYQRQLRLDEIQALRNEFSPMTAGVPQDFIWETKFDLDYKETKSGIVGVPYQPNAFSIATDSTGVDKFAGGYLKARKTNSDTTGIEYPNTSSLLDLSVGAMSVSLWLRAPNWSSYSQLLGGTRPYDGANGFVLFADFESQGVLDFRSSQNTSRPSPRVNLDSQWHHYVFTRQNRDNWIAYGDYIWYKDGFASRYGVDTGNINGSQQNMKLCGGFNWGKCAYFDLAYFRIYDRVLTQTEVNALYNETIIPPKRFPEDYVFHATLSDNLTADDGRRGTVVVDSDEDGVYQTEQEGIECTFIPSNNRVRFEDDGLPLGNTNRTMSIWVRPSKDYNTWNNVIGYGDNQTKKLCVLGYRDGFTASASAYNYDLESSTELLDGWNHLLLKWDNDFTSDFACYLNGVRVADNGRAIQAVLDTAHTWLCIGGRPTSSDYFCENAYFADARIYDYAMTDQQITSIYEAGINDTGLGTQCKCSDESVFFTADGIQELYQLNLAYDDEYTYETADTLPNGCSLASNGVVEFDGTGSGTDEQASIVVTVSKTGHVSSTMNVYITVTAVQQVEYCSNCGWEMTDGYCPNQDCPNSPNYVPPVEYCPECGQELMDGVCQNMDCPSSPYYAPQEELCPECGGVMQGGICENSWCPASPNYMPEEPPMEEPPMEEP